MALDTRLIGQALGEGKPVDVAGAMQPAMQRGEFAIQRTLSRKAQQERELKAENQRRESLQARAISQLKDLDQTKISPQIREYMTNKAFALKQAALNVIQDKSIDPITAQLEIQKYMGEINTLAAQANDFKQWQLLFVDTDKEDLSALNTPEIYSKVNDIQEGNMQLLENGNFKFPDGSEYSFDDMLKIKHVNKRSDSYMSTLGAVEKLGLQAGLRGAGNDVFKANLDSELKALKLTDADYASIAVDYMGMNAETSLGKKIKADFEEDGDFDDENLKKEVYDFVINKFTEAAQTTYGIGKKEYNSKTSVTTPKLTESDKKRMQTIEDVQTFVSDFDNKKQLFGIGRNQAGVFTGKVNFEDKNFDKALNEIGYQTVDIFRASEDDPTITSITIKRAGDPNSRAIEILPNESAQVFIRKLLLDQGATPKQAQSIAYTFNPEEDKYSQYKEE